MGDPFKLFKVTNFEIVLNFSPLAFVEKWEVKFFHAIFG